MVSMPGCTTSSSRWHWTVWRSRRRRLRGEGRWGEWGRGRVGDGESGRVGDGESGRRGEWETGRVGESGGEWEPNVRRGNEFLVSKRRKVRLRGLGIKARWYLGRGEVG